MPLNIDDATQAYLATLSAQELAASKAYTTGGHWLLLWGLVVSALVTLILMRWGVLARVRDVVQQRKPRPHLAAFVVGATFIGLSWTLGLPWELYTLWYRERSYRLSTQPFSDWLVQSGISNLVSMILGGLLALGIYFLIRRTGRWWWAWAGAFVGLLFTFLVMVAPVVIEPLFNDYTPIAEGPVKQAITSLAAQAHVSPDSIVVYDGSRQRAILTANVTGLAGTMRIGISDVALKEATLPEVRAVVAHELGHYVSGDLPVLAAAFALLALLGFYAIDRIFDRAVVWCGASPGVSLADPAGVPLLVLLISAWFTLCGPLTNALERRGEVAADAYSLQTAREPDGLATALLKSAKYRDPTPHPVTELLFHSHPSIAHRIHAAMVWKAANGAGVVAKH